MTITNFPNGASSFGAPILPGPGASLPNYQGKVLFVAPSTASPIGDGTDPSAPFSTIQAAINACNDASGSTIYIFPGTYNENVTITKSKIALVAAVQTGNAKRVAIAPTTGIAFDIQTGALSTVCTGIRFVGTSAVGCKLAADGCAFYDCDFTSDTTHGLSTVGQTVDNSNTGSGAQIVNCIFRDCGGEGINQGFTTGKTLFATNVNVLGCQFYNNTSYDIADENEGGNQAYWDHWDINGCKFMTKSKTTYLNMNGAGTDNGAGTLVSGNWFNSTALDSTKIQMPTSGLFVGNFDIVGVVNGTGF